ncbi:hypothetical protein B0H14DRAFT_3467814 [Mycena olivaceomarginata]|nr:hypothetical protein B0H14DRAFT_3467814 [Mycena olivaceomarginata]
MAKTRGPKTKRSPEQTEFLESHLPEFLAKQPNLATFWPSIERGYFALWPEEPNLGLPIVDRSIEDSGLTDADLKLLGDAEAKTTKKEKRLANAPASSSTAMDQLVSALLGGTGGKRKKQVREIWQKQNGPLIKAALAETNFASLMPPPLPGETKQQAADRVAEGARQQMIVRRRVEKTLFEEASDGEMDEVRKIYALQTVEKPANTKSETPEEFQRGLDNLDPLMKTFHGLVNHLTGWVGTTMLTGPMPRVNGQIATQSYCHGTTPSGHSMAESVSSWNEGFLVPLQQFGKKVFGAYSAPLDFASIEIFDFADHQTRRARALGASKETGEGSSGAESLPDERNQPSAAGEYPTSLDEALYTIPPAPESAVEEPPQDEHDLQLPLANAPQSDPGCSTGDIAIDPMLLGISSPDNVADDPFALQDQCIPLHDKQHSDLLPRPDAEFDLRPLSADSPSHHGLTSTLINFRFHSEQASAPAPAASITPQRPLPRPAWHGPVGATTRTTPTQPPRTVESSSPAASAEPSTVSSPPTPAQALAQPSAPSPLRATTPSPSSTTPARACGAASDHNTLAVSADTCAGFDPAICTLTVAGDHNPFSLDA